MEESIQSYESALHETKQIMNSMINLQRITNFIVERAASVVGAKGATLFVLDQSGDQLVAAASYGLSLRYLSKGSIKADKSISETLDGNTVLIVNPPMDPRVQYPEAAKEEGIASILSLPLSLEGEVIGALRVYASHGYEFSKGAIEFLKSLCKSGVSAIQNACRFETALNRHETIMTDIWKWFHIKSTD